MQKIYKVNLSGRSTFLDPSQHTHTNTHRVCNTVYMLFLKMQKDGCHARSICSEEPCLAIDSAEKLADE